MKLLLNAALTSLLIHSFYINADTSKITVATADWQPYINAEHQPLGSSAEVLRQVFLSDGREINWTYYNYDLAYTLVKQKKIQTAYPFFKTKERVKHVLFSKPVFSVTNRLYFNRQFNSVHNNFTKQRFGRVAGYSYSESIDELLGQAKVFDNEVNALRALLDNDIDYLPMTESVMNHLLNTRFTHHSLLIKPLDEIQGKANLHLIAANNETGQAIIQRLNTMLDSLKNIESLQPQPLSRDKKIDLAKLIAAEAHPLILGQTRKDMEGEYFALPQGTEVLVISWGDKIMKPSQINALNKVMMDYSKVVILNGPHVGKELFVRNMHIALQ